MVSLAPCHAQAQGKPDSKEAKKSPDAKSVEKSQETKLIEPEANGLMRDLCAYIAAAKSFSFRAAISYDELIPTGQLIERSGELEVVVKRPNRIYVRYIGDTFAKRIWYDGEQVTVFDEKKNFYAVADAPETLDQTLTLIRDRFNMRLPLADFAFEDPYAQLTPHFVMGFRVGRSKVGKIVCEQMAFSGDDLDFQLWVEDGQQLLPRKVVIHHVRIAGAPRYTAVLSNWKLNAKFPDRLFEPKLPVGAKQIGFLLTSDEQPAKTAPKAPNKKK